MNIATAPSSKDLWRVAAMTVMGKNALTTVLSGDDAVTWVKAAATCGLSTAQLRLGRMLLEGQGIARNRPSAFSCFVAAAAQGNAEAHNMLGRCYENGWGTERDYALAAVEYRIAADAGLDWTQYNLGHVLLSGNGVERDHAAAFTWYSRAASQGHVRAMNLLARCYEEGWGVKKNALIAMEWFRASARGGYFRGAFNYAGLLTDDGCVAGASYWFARAVATATEPTRSNMVTTLSCYEIPAIRALGTRLSEQYATPETSS